MFSRLIRSAVARLALVTALAVLASTAAEARAAKRYALLVGVNDYDHAGLPALGYAVADVAELRDVLAKAGYEVVLLTADEARKKDDKALTPTKDNVEAQLKALVKKFAKGDMVLIGLAGHGLQFAGDEDGYFCPQDARPFQEKTDTLVSIKWIYQRLHQDAADGVKLLLVDACRSIPKVRGRGIDAGGAPPPPQGVGILLSCAAGQRAVEGERWGGGHGVFFHYVLEGLKGKARDEEGIVTWDSLRTYVKKRVPKDQADQTPEYAGRETGVPVLIDAAGLATTGSPVVKPGPTPEGPPSVNSAGDWALSVRRGSEADFTRDTRKFAIQIIRDEKAGATLCVSETGAVRVLTDQAEGASEERKEPRWRHRLDLKVHSADDPDLKKDPHKFGVEVFRDDKDNLFYVTETGGMAVVPSRFGKGGDPESSGKAPRRRYWLRHQVRHAGEAKFSSSTRMIRVEVFRDENNGHLLYVSESGDIAVVPAKFDKGKNEGGGPDWVSGWTVQVRRAAEADFSPESKKYAFEVLRDDNNGNLLYVTETGAIAVVPAQFVKKGEGEAEDKKPRSLYRLTVSLRRGEGETKKIGVEVYRDEHNGQTIYLSDKGAIDCLLK
jgi:hypothetical protein